MPETTCAATRDGSSTVCSCPSTPANPNADTIMMRQEPTQTSIWVRIPAAPEQAFSFEADQAAERSGGDQPEQNIGVRDHRVSGMRSRFKHSIKAGVSAPDNNGLAKARMTHI